MKLLGKATHYDRIVAYMKDENAEVDLTAHEKSMLDRWMEAFTLMRNYNSTADTAAILMKRFPGLSRATAYRDCSNAISLFGDISKSTKEGIRHLTTEIIRDAIELARSKNDGANMIKGAVAIARVNGVNDTDPDLPDFELLEPHTYELGLDDKMIGALRSMIAGGKVDLGMIVDAMSAGAVDAEYVEEPKQLPNGNS